MNNDEYETIYVVLEDSNGHKIHEQAASLYIQDVAHIWACITHIVYVLMCY